jgi:hypothetical protein
LDYIDPIPAKKRDEQAKQYIIGIKHSFSKYSIFGLVSVLFLIQKAFKEKINLLLRKLSNRVFKGFNQKNGVLFRSTDVLIFDFIGKS